MSTVKPNRLIESSSPYLLQHAYNPVDWREWGEPAFEDAKQQDKPIFLSVGYSTCHWCHVMERESFEDEDVAALLNELFVPIKVDREQRPDIDEQYMLATQLATRRGGWPNTVILTPDGRPWYAGTYYPKPQLMQLATQLGQAWQQQRDQVEQQADQFVRAIREVGAGAQAAADRPLTFEAMENGVKYFTAAYDSRNGGFGGAPKFPPHGALTMMLQQQRIKPDRERLGMVTHTLDAIEHGGIHDHLGGGFHRYATDSRWFLPHFEKMLYDNAQLVQAYTRAYAITHEPRYREVVRRVFEWLKREMTDEGGGFYSAIDADSEGVEGKFYVWTLAEIRQALEDEDDAAVFAHVYGVTEQGNYLEEATRERTGANVLYLPQPIEQAAAELNIEPTELQRRLAEMRVTLLTAREQRVRPHLDDKVLSGWNGLMFGALAEAGRVFEEPAYIEAAQAAADFVLDQMRDEAGRLRRNRREGRSSGLGYLDDYAYVVVGLIDLHEAGAGQQYLDAAEELVRIMLAEFHDAEAGGFYFTSNAHETLLMRAKELGGGGNMPAGNGVAAAALLRLAVIQGERRYAELAADTLNAFAGMMGANPHGAESLLTALAAYQELASEHELPPLHRAVESDADAAERHGPVLVEAYLSHDQVKPGDAIDATVRLTLDTGHHVYAKDPGGDSLTPTQVQLESDGVVEAAGEPTYPEPQSLTDPVLGETVQVYRGRADVQLPLRITTDAEPGQQHLTLEVHYQPCDDRACQAPQTVRLELPLTIGEQTGERRHRNIFGGGT